MASPWLAAGAGAAGGLEVLLARQREEEMLRMREQAQVASQGLAQQQFGEAQRSNRADEGYRDRALDENIEVRKMQAQAQIQNQMNVDQDRDSARTMASLALRPINAPVSMDEYARETSAGAPSALYDQSGPTTLPNGDQGPAMPTIAFRGTQAQQMAQTKETNDVANEQARLRAQTEQNATNADLRRESMASMAASRETSTAARMQMADIARDREQRLQSYGGPTTQISDPNSPTGNRVIPRSELPQGGAPAPAPPALTTQGIQNDVSTAQLDRLEQMFKPDYVGPLAGRMKAIGQQIPGVDVDPGFAEFNAATAAFRNQIIKAITGAQMSEVEATRIRAQIPEVSDKPEVWQAKARQSRLNMQDLAARIANKPTRTGGGAGAGISGAATTPAPGGDGFQQVGKYRVRVKR